jgi:hypothetical protein
LLNHGDDYSDLPLLSIISTNGVNAVLLPKTISIGNIKKLKVIEPYFNRNSSFDILTDCSIITENGNGAIININEKRLSNCLLEQKRDVVKSNEMLLHDSDRINQYSYEIRSSIPLERVKHLIEEHCHQAGTIGFNNVDITEDVVMANGFDNNVENIGIY